MDSEQEKFHQIALHSILFKGHYDWYFCFLKSERIARALLSIAGQGGNASPLDDAARLATQVPQSFLQFAANEMTPEAVLADLFSLLSQIRLCAVSKRISQENSSILVQECQILIARFAGSMPPSPFVSQDDFSVPGNLRIEQSSEKVSGGSVSHAGRPDTVKDNKGQYKTEYKGRSERSDKILAFVSGSQGVSIKDIVIAIHEYGEKTIQRELVLLVRQGLVKKTGERRWSMYFPAA